MFKKKIVLMIFLWLLCQKISYCQPEPTNTLISVITCSPGNDIYTVYGHTAIRLRDTFNKEDIVFNYGTFDFQTDGFIYKFLKGRLPYYLAAGHFDRFLESYKQEGRSVTEQVITLNDSQKAHLINALWVNAAPENREYMYDFFFDNCSTRVRDILGQVIKTNWGESVSSNKTFRDLIKEFQVQSPWTDFGIDLIIGAKADIVASRKEACFLPNYFMDEIDRQSPLILQEKTMLTPASPVQLNKSFTSFFLSPMGVFSILLLLEFFFIFQLMNAKLSKWSKIYDTAWVVILLIAFIIMAFMWFGTDHKATKDNWNILWVVLPLPILLFKKFTKSIYFISVGILGCLVLNIAFQLLIIPQKFHIALSLVLLILIVKITRGYLEGSKINFNSILP
ncbi:MAG: DUF4105 domain-containing protein [Saprospiraceae bacterium]